MLKSTSQPEALHVTKLVTEAKQDLKVFGELYLLYAQPVFRYTYSRIGRRSEAEDVTAQTFLAALERFPHYRHQGYFASWLFAIARNKVMDYFRKQCEEVPLDEAETIPAEANLLQQVIKTERSAFLAELISALPEDEQELIRLRYLAELNFAEIGHLLVQKEDTVKKTLYRLLARLKAQVDTEYPPEDSHVTNDTYPKI
jgi:RNA polymerase sigma-70 factor (ECF subfamily)